ncbi:hypothetical protein ACFS5L_31405 [Streptomyces phyllanthi]|uniref:hypothetical protein n=1 Tax=Streptomyces phyllanthi TaxID=1803180 RepID=UPI0031E8253A
MIELARIREAAGDRERAALIAHRAAVDHLQSGVTMELVASRDEAGDGEAAERLAVRVAGAGAGGSRPLTDPAPAP